jgi:hypothetical protein
MTFRTLIVFKFSTVSRRSYFFWYRRSGSLMFILVSEHTSAPHIKPRIQFCTTHYNSTNLDISTSHILSFPRLHAVYVLDLRSAFYCMAWHRIAYTHTHIAECCIDSGLSAVRSFNQQRLNNMTTAYTVFYFDFQEWRKLSPLHAYFPFYIPNSCIE